jgi:hypothetical protein
MKIKTFVIAGALPAIFLVSAVAKSAEPSAKQVEDIRRQFFMPVATNSLCPEEYRVSGEKFAAFRNSVLTYLDYLHGSAEEQAKPQFETARAEITGADIPAPFLAESTKIYRSYPPDQARFFFCQRLNRMFDMNIDMMGMMMRQEQKRRGESRSD